MKKIVMWKTQLKKRKEKLVWKSRKFKKNNIIKILKEKQRKSVLKDWRRDFSFFFLLSSLQQYYHMFAAIFPHTKHSKRAKKERNIEKHEKNSEMTRKWNLWPMFN